MIVQFVQFETALTEEEVVAVANARLPQFRAIPGLVQKYYLADTEPGYFGGFYLWRSIDDVQQYRESELAATIASAYEGIGAPEVRVFEIVMPLRDD